jgi:hypothetical protein
LRSFLDLELPAATLIRSSYSKPERFIALNAAFEVRCSAPSAFQVELVFDGLQLYANGHIGRSVHSQRASAGSVLRRALDNTWWNLSFNGCTPAAEPIDRWSYVPGRDFYFQEERLFDESGAELRTIPE